MAAFDTTRLVSQITIKGALADGSFSDQEILDLAYDALLSELVPLILAKKEEYYVRQVEYPIIAGQSAYEIPNRAIGGTLREVKWIANDVQKHIERVDPKKVDRVQTGQPYRFYVQGNDIVLWPTPSASQYTLRLTYFIRPSRLVPVSECGQITAINGQVVDLAIPTGWVITERFDLIKGKPGYDILHFDLVASSVDSGLNQITFSSALPSTLAVGDWVSLAEETCFPFLPTEGHIALIQCAVTSALESMGDPALAVSAQRAEAQKAAFERLLAVRVLGQPKSFGTRVL